MIRKLKQIELLTAAIIKELPITKSENDKTQILRAALAEILIGCNKAKSGIEIYKYQVPKRKLVPVTDDRNKITEQGSMTIVEVNKYI